MPGNASDSSLVRGGFSCCTKCLKYNMASSHTVRREKRIERGEEYFLHPVGKGAVQHVYGWLAPQAGNITLDSWLNLCWRRVAKLATSCLSCLADWVKPVQAFAVGGNWQRNLTEGFLCRHEHNPTASQCNHLTAVLWSDRESNDSIWLCDSAILTIHEIRESWLACNNISVWLIPFTVHT